MFSNKFRVCLGIAALLWGILAPFKAEATLDLKWYQVGKSQLGTKDSVESYVSGLRDGIILFDAYRHRYENVKKTFCSEREVLDGAKTILILDLEIADPSTGRPYPEDIPIVFLLIKALERFASCK